MSAAEIIEQIKALPKIDRQRVVEFVRNIDDQDVATPPVKYVDDATFKAAKDRVFEKHEELLRKLAQ